jgi:hypothetical protein
MMHSFLLNFQSQDDTGKLINSYMRTLVGGERRARVPRRSACAARVCCVRPRRRSRTTRWRGRVPASTGSPLWPGGGRGLRAPRVLRRPRPPQQAIANREAKVLNIRLDDLRDVRAGEGPGPAGPPGGERADALRWLGAVVDGWRRGTREALHPHSARSGADRTRSRGARHRQSAHARSRAPCPLAVPPPHSPAPAPCPQYLAEVDPARRRLLDDVKANTMRYVGIAAEAADEAMPPPEGLPQADIFDRLLESVSRLRGGARAGCWGGHARQGAAALPPACLTAPYGIWPVSASPACAWCTVGTGA